MRKIFTLGLILILLIPIFPQALPQTNETSSDWELLENILEDFEGNPNEAELVFNGVIKDKFMDQNAISMLGNDLVSKLELVGEEIDPFILEDFNLDNAYSKRVIFEDDYSQINYDGYDKGKNQISINLN